jgi:hypothetical protein
MVQFQVLLRNSPGETQKNIKTLSNAGLWAEVWSPHLPKKQ